MSFFYFSRFCWSMLTPQRDLPPSKDHLLLNRRWYEWKPILILTAIFRFGILKTCCGRRIGCVSDISYNFAIWNHIKAEVRPVHQWTFSLATRATNQSAGRNLKYLSRQLMLKSPKPKWRSVSWRYLRKRFSASLPVYRADRMSGHFSQRVTVTWTGPGRAPLCCVGCMRVSLHQTLLGNGSVATCLLWAFWLIWRNSHFHGYGLHLSSMLIL